MGDLLLAGAVVAAGVTQVVVADLGHVDYALGTRHLESRVLDGIVVECVQEGPRVRLPVLHADASQQGHSVSADRGGQVEVFSFRGGKEGSSGGLGVAVVQSVGYMGGVDYPGGRVSNVVPV